MKSLWRELKPLVRHLAVFSFCMNLLFLVPAVFTLQVFDRVIPSNSMETLAVLVLGTTVALGFLLVLDFVRNRLQNALGVIIDERLAPPVVSAIVSAAARAPHTSRPDGIRDVTAVRSVFSANGLVALFDAPWVAVYLAVIWLCHPALGIGAAVSIALMLALAWLNAQAVSRVTAQLQREGRRAANYIDSSLRNAEVLQALGMTQRLLARWRALQEEVASVQTQAGRSAVAYSALARFLRQAIQIFMMALGAYLVLSQQASPGVMIATTILLGRALQPVEQIVANWRPLTDALAAYRRVRELIGDDFDRVQPHLTLPRPDGRLTVESLSCRPQGSDRLILTNVSFALAPGEALAIIGPSAAGKSTLARLLTGVWGPSAGSARLDGVEVSAWPREDLGPWVGYVPQDVELFDGTVADNIARLGEPQSEAVIAAARRANVHEMILALPDGYDTQVGEHGARLSPGQRQRIALARALYGDPRLVVLDEPNSNLDGGGEIALAQALSGLRAEGVTSVVVTHRPSLVAHVDKILVLEAGRMQQYGPAAEVMKAMQMQAQALVAGKAA